MLSATGYHPAACRATSKSGSHSKIIGIDAAIALVLVPQGVLDVSRFEIDMDFEVDDVVFLAICTLFDGQFARGNGGEISR